MSHLFTLTPDATLLVHCGYFTSDMHRLFTQELTRSGSTQVEHQGIWTEEKRKEVEDRFTELVSRYKILEHRNTLLYVSLLESNHSNIIYQRIYNNYTQRLRDKQLAQFLLLFKPGSKHLPINLKVSSVTDTIKLTDVELIGWLGTLMQEFIGKAEFNPTMHGETLFKFIINDHGGIDADSKLNYEMIDYLAKQTIRKPGIRDRNKLLAAFLLKVWNVLNRGTSLTAPNGVRFSDNQLKFLFEVAEVFGWLNNLKLNSDPKDYLYTLLVNHAHRK